MSTPESPELISRLPRPIVAKLEEILQRRRSVRWHRGLWLTISVLVIGLLIAIAVDWWLDWEASTMRWLMSLALVVWTSWTAWKHWVQPLRKAPSLATVARWLEIQRPEMQERLSTAVELIGSNDQSQASQELIDQVVKAAELDVGSVSAKETFSATLITWPQRGALGALGVLLLVLLLAPRQAGTLLVRAVAPFLNIGSASAYELRVITKDIMVAEGDPVTVLIAVKAAKKDRRVELKMTTPSGREAIERLMPETSPQLTADEQGFALKISQAKETFRYRAIAGKARSAEHQITVRSRPQVISQTIELTYPAYTGLPPKRDEEASGDIEALGGTRADVTWVLNRLPETGTVLLGGEPSGLELITDATGRAVAKWSHTLPTQVHRTYTLTLRDGDLAMLPREREIRAVDDLNPAILIDSPVERNITLKPTESLPIFYTAADDFGFSSAELIISFEGNRGEEALAAVLPEKDKQLAQTWHGKATLNLAELKLNGIKRLKVKVRVADTLPKDLDGPQVADSEEISVKIDDGARSWMEQVVQTQERQLREAIDKVKRDLWQEKSTADRRREQLKHEPQKQAEAMEKVDKLAAETQATAQQLEKLARQAEQSFLTERAEVLERAAQELVKPATEALHEVAQQDSAEARAEMADQAAKKLEEAAKSLDLATDNMWQDKQQAEQTGQLAALAAQQAQLAQEAQTMPKEAPTADTAKQAREATQQWETRQQRVKSEVQNLNAQLQGQNPQQKQDQLKSLAQRAEELAQKAETLATQQDQAEQQAKEATAAAQTPKAEAESKEAAETQASVAQQAQALAAEAKLLLEQGGKELSQNGKAQAQVATAQSELTQANAEGTKAAEAFSKTSSPKAEMAREAAKAVAETSQSLDAASASLKSAAATLKTQAAAMTDHSAALSGAQNQTEKASEAAKQARETAEQAGQEAASQAAQQGQNIDTARHQAMAQAASSQINEKASGPAKQAALDLALAVARAQAASGTPQEALQDQAMGEKGRPTPGQGQGENQQQAQNNQQGQSKPGQGEQAGLQSEKEWGLPPELEKLGLSQDDWVRIRGFVSSGAESLPDDRVPVEYRDLVKGYFKALSESSKK